MPQVWFVLTIDTAGVGPGVPVTSPSPCKPLFKANNLQYSGGENTMTISSPQKPLLKSPLFKNLVCIKVFLSVALVFGQYGPSTDVNMSPLIHK